MTIRRIAVASLGLLTAAAIVGGIGLALGLFIPQLAVEAQEAGRGTGNAGNTGNGDRLMQAVNVLRSNPSPDAAEEAIFHGLEALMGGLRPLHSKDLPDRTEEADRKFSEREMMFAQALEQFIGKGRNDAPKGLALNAKQIVEEMNQVARVLSNATSQCGVGDLVLMEGGEAENFENPCSQLQPLLNQLTGLEDEPSFQLTPDTTPQVLQPIGASYSINLRADLVPPRWQRDIPEHVEVTEPLAPGECAVVFKEFRGLLLQLHLERITSVRDPNNNSGLSGEAAEPVWILQWMPAQYGKQWSMCNTGSATAPTVTTKVTRQIVEDEGLIYFWRYYD